MLALSTPATELFTDGGRIAGRNIRVIFFLPYFSFLFKIYLFQLRHNFFTILCWFLPYININQPLVYICPLPGGSVVKYLVANAGDTGLIPVAGKIPWRRKW